MSGDRRLRALRVIERVKEQDTERSARAAAELRSRIEALEATRAELLHRITRESRIEGLEGAAYLGQFIRAIRAEVERVQHQIDELTPARQKAEDALRDALAEQKTYEILRLRRLADNRRDAARRDTARQDEIARLRWQR
ncbi:flagellar FliJ family protein [Pseudooceanicola aestuarii]|uniref:flagellar FliJ family protein n=1 Tax=Pseudooceanicola aestuarii TaxID=2697319 RepID=UPI0013D39161|nr:flagellar FliJ family protein [Pseudooceanicola aestuarii]